MSNPNTPTPTATATLESNTSPGVLSFNVSAPLLRAALHACAPAMSKDPNRYVLNGVHFELAAVKSAQAIRDGSAPHVLTLSGCDGRRLHVAQIPVDELSLPPSPARSLSFILPAEAVKAALKQTLPAKIKTGEALLSFPRRAAGLVNPALVRWLVINTAAGEFASPETEGNFPNVRQVIPAERLDDSALCLSLRAILNAQDMEKETLETFSAACVQRAWTSAADAQRGFSFTQVKAAATAAARKVFKDLRKRDSSMYFERGPSGQLIPIKATVGPIPSGVLFSNDCTRAEFIEPQGGYSLSYGPTAGNLSAPACAAAGFNPAFLADLADALEALRPVPGAVFNETLCSPKPGDGGQSFTLRPVHPMDSGKGFVFLAVIMSQRIR